MAIETPVSTLQSSPKSHTIALAVVVVFLVAVFVLGLSLSSRSKSGSTDEVYKKDVISKLEAEAKSAPALSEGEKAEIIASLESEAGQVELSEAEKTATLQELSKN